MQKLFLHIEYLLSEHDCVIVPGIGAFIVNHIPAAFDSDGNILNPPLKKVSFNPLISNNDGLIIKSVSRRDCILYGEAESLVRKLTDKLKNELKNGGSVLINNVGILEGSEDGRIIFTSDKDAGIAASRIQVFFPDLQDLQNEHEGCSAEGDAGAVKKLSGKYYYFRIRKTVANSAAALIAVLISTLVLFNPIGSDTGINREEASIVPEPSIIRCNNEETMSPETELTEREVSSVDSVSVVYRPYHLIIATLRTDKEVEAIKHQYRGSQYRLKIIEEGKHKRVAIASSSQRDSLQTLMGSTDIRKEFPDAWIWKEK